MWKDNNVVRKLSTLARSAAFLATLAVVASTAACSGASGAPAAQASASDAPGPIEVWTRSGATSAPTYERIFAAFTKKTGIKVNYQPQVEFDQQLQARASSKDLPDLMINDAGSLGTYQSQGLLQPIDKNAIKGADQIDQKTWDSAKGLDGKYYGIPFSRQAMVMVVRTDWLKKLGLSIPTTWDDVTNVAKAFATEDPDGDGNPNDTYGMVVPGTTENGYIAWWGSSYIYEGGGSIVKKNSDDTYSSAIDSSGTKKAVNWMRQQFCTPGSVAPGSLNLTTSQALFFKEGTAGLYLTAPNNISQLDQSVGKDKYAVIPTPKGPAGQQVLAEGENIYLGAGSDKTNAAKKLAEYLISPEGQKEAITAATEDGSSYQPAVRLPVNTTVDVGKVTNDPRWSQVQENYDKDGVTYPFALNFAPIKQSLAETLNSLMANCNSNIDSALKDLNTTINGELKDQGVGK